MAAKNYGITFCKKVLRSLAKEEDKLFAERGSGFDLFGQELQTEIKYKKLLKAFTKEKKDGREPSYDPGEHGSLD